MQRAHVLRRWRDIIALAAIGGFLGGTALALTPVDRLLNRATSILVPLDWRFQSFFVLAFGVLALLPVLWMAPLRWKHLSNSHRYPSVWIAAFLSIALAAAWYCLVITVAVVQPNPVQQYDLLDWLTSSLILAISVPVAACLLTLSESSGASSESDHAAVDLPVHSLDATIANPTYLVKWAEAPEDPIQSPSEDLFSIQHIAFRIARRLSAEKKANFGISAPFGSGKSSLVQLVEYFCRQQNSSTGKRAIWFCRVSCWVFDDSRAALRYLLTRIIERISEEVDVTALRGLPADYIKAASSAGDWLEALLARAGDSESIEDRIRRFTPILEACRARLVVAVEDLDRNESRNFDAQEVFAALDQLRIVDGLSFILTGHAPTMDFSRLCDYIELIPELDVKTAWKAVRAFRDHCVRVGQDIDPTPTSRRNVLWEEESHHEIMSYVLGPDRPCVPRALLKLLRNPRALRHTLRLTMRVWEGLRGEVDLDELLVLCALRTSAEQAFEFVRARISELRSSPSSRSASEWQQFIDRDWKAAVGDARFDRGSAAVLISYLLPQHHESEVFPHGVGTDESPQGVRYSEPHKYFERIMAEEVSPGDVRDQDVLRAVRLAKQSGDMGSLAGRLLGSTAFAAVWEALDERSDPGARLARRQLLALASVLFRRGLSEHKEAMHGELPAIMSVWRRAQESSDEHGNAAMWLADEIRCAADVSISLASDIYYYWASEKFGIAPYDQRSAVRDAARRSCWESLQVRWRDAKGKSFADALCRCKDDRRAGYELYHVVFPGDDDESPSPIRTPEEWSWIGPVTVRALREDPERMALRVFQLVRARKPNMTPRSGFDASVLRGIFGEEASHVVRLLRESADHVLPGTDDAAGLRRAADEWLSEHENTSG